MESRKITIVASREQKKYVIESAAETLGELKADLDAVGIDYTDQDFIEGLSRSTLIDNDSQLPKNVTRTNRQTGATEVTNELVFMLTNSNKKIKSGVLTRDECYKYIKEHSLKDEIKKVYDKPFTCVSTDELNSYIQEHSIYSKPLDTKKPVECKATDEDTIKKAIKTLVYSLYSEEAIISRNTYDKILSILDEEETNCSCEIDDETAELFEDLL